MRFLRRLLLRLGFAKRSVQVGDMFLNKASGFVYVVTSTSPISYMMSNPEFNIEGVGFITPALFLLDNYCTFLGNIND